MVPATLFSPSWDLAQLGLLTPSSRTLNKKITFRRRFAPHVFSLARTPWNMSVSRCLYRSNDDKIPISLVQWMDFEKVAGQWCALTDPVCLHTIQSTSDLFQSCSHAIIHTALITALFSAISFFPLLSSPSFGDQWVGCLVCKVGKKSQVCKYEPWDPLWWTNILRDISNWITAGVEQLSLWAG